jgi:hypothetical protein
MRIALSAVAKIKKIPSGIPVLREYVTDASRRTQNRVVSFSISGRGRSSSGAAGLPM